MANRRGPSSSKSGIGKPAENSLLTRWPGNVRELENLIEREFLLAKDSATLRLSTAKWMIDVVHDDGAQTNDSMNYRAAKARVLEAFDRDFLSALLRDVRGNVTAAARVAGKERRDLARLLRKYNIAPAKFRV